MFKKSKAFTLVELVVVMVIIGLLFVFLIPKIDFATTKARESGIKTDFHSFEIAFESVCNEESGIGGTQFTDESDAITAFNGYLDAALNITYAASDASVSAKTDPWNNAYHFVYAQTADSNNGIACVYSEGKKENAVYSVEVPADTATATVTTAVTLDDGDAGYYMATAYVDGITKTVTGGFSKNIQ